MDESSALLEGVEQAKLQGEWRGRFEEIHEQVKKVRVFVALLVDPLEL